jgi:uncharacterized membrane protein YphA (DoxX/SURF4 family)
MVIINKHKTMNSRTVQWILKIAVAGEFLGHGVFALQQKQGWLKYFSAVGIGTETANTLMILIGIMDVVLAILILVKPIRVAVLWMTVWALITAMIRWPIGPDPVWDFLERWANWGAPLALLMLQGWPRSIKEWFR